LLCTLCERFLDLLFAGSFSRWSKIGSSGEASRTTTQTSDIVLRRLLRQEVLAARHNDMLYAPRSCWMRTASSLLVAKYLETRESGDSLGKERDAMGSRVQLFAREASRDATTPIYTLPSRFTCRRRKRFTMQDPSQGVAAPLVRKYLPDCNQLPTNTRSAKPPSFDLRPPVPARRAPRHQCSFQIPA
jgi:hypothetical protein